MNDSSNGLATEVDRAAGPGSGLRRRVRAALLPVAVLLACLGLAFVMLETGPVAERKPRPRLAHLVEVEPVETTRERVRIQAMGTVVPARQIVLQPQVSGRIVEVDPEFVPGGRFAAGDVMVRIDPRDYELALRQRQSELTQARSDLQIEVGNQSVAALEYELLGEAVPDADRDLVLRQPQLESVRARIASAESAVAQARLDLERAVIRAPFDALVLQRSTELGARVDSGTDLATLVDTSAYWVQVLVPVGQLAWIETGDLDRGPGSLALVSVPGAPAGRDRREGRVVRLLGDLETEGRMARLLVRVEDPIALRPEHAGRPRLLLDSFVNVRIEGRELDGVVAIDRSRVRDGDRVLIMNDEGALEIRDVTIAFRGEREVFVSDGLAEDERLVVSELSSAVAGMALRIESALAGATASNRATPAATSAATPDATPAATPGPLQAGTGNDVVDRL
jgi:RND family efflux transporter MFP subunit